MDKKITTIRLDKFLSNAGVCSRRGVKDVLRDKIVTIGGIRVKASGIRVDLSKDKVLIDGVEVKQSGYVYIMLNKPMGYITTTSDEQGRATVMELVKRKERIYPIGRLDKDTHGLILLTNDGELTHKLIHPRYHVPKVYRLTIADRATTPQLRAFRHGVLLEDGITLPAGVSIVEEVPKKSVLEVILHEGRNRQIRRMCETVGMHLLDLQRVSFGPLVLGKLKLGENRELADDEVEALRQTAESNKVSTEKKP